MTHASLFSGIGGAELAAAWMGWTNLFHCEINPFGRKVLEYWFPNSKSYDDITKTDFTPWRGRVSVLTGGFPCQPFSLAGKRKGAQDDRYLWPQMLRAIREIQPTWVVGENVAGLTTMVQPGETADMGRSGNLFEENHLYRTTARYTLDEILASLEDAGYTVQPFLIPACAVGAPHRRDRLWIVAHSTGARTENEPTWAEQPDTFGLAADTIDAGVRASQYEREQQGQTQPCQGKDGSLSGIGRLGDKQFFANASDERCNGRSPYSDKWQEKKQERKCLEPDIERPFKERLAADADSNRRRHGQGKQKPEQGSKGDTDNRVENDNRIQKPDWANFPSVSPVCRGNDGLPFDLARLTIPEPRWRKEAIKAMGNAWVPQVAYEIFRAIQTEENKCL